MTFAVVDPRSPDAVAAVTAYFGELDERFPEGFDEWDAIEDEAPQFVAPSGAFVLVEVDGAVAGCAGIRTLEPGVGEIKRMWVAPERRGAGVAGRLLDHLESLLRGSGHHAVRLDTHAVLDEAIRLYERAGYRAIDRYNDNPYAQRWFEKRLS